MSHKRLNWTTSRIIDLFISFEIGLPLQFTEAQWLNIVGKKYDDYLGEYTDDIAGMAWAIILFLSNNRAISKISESEYRINREVLRALIKNWSQFLHIEGQILTSEVLGESFI